MVVHPLKCVERAHRLIYCCRRLQISTMLRSMVKLLSRSIWTRLETPPPWGLDNPAFLAFSTRSFRLSATFHSNHFALRPSISTFSPSSFSYILLCPLSNVFRVIIFFAGTNHNTYMFAPWFIHDGLQPFYIRGYLRMARVADTQISNRCKSWKPPWRL